MPCDPPTNPLPPFPPPGSSSKAREAWRALCSKRPSAEEIQAEYDAYRREMRITYLIAALGGLTMILAGLVGAGIIPRGIIPY